MKHSIIALGVLLGVGLLSACGSSNPPDVTGPGGSAEPVFTPRDQPPPGEWRKGDMHVHTDHSNDGSFLRQGLDDRAPGPVVAFWHAAIFSLGMFFVVPQMISIGLMFTTAYRQGLNDVILGTTVINRWVTH